MPFKTREEKLEYARQYYQFHKKDLIAYTRAYEKRIQKEDPNGYRLERAARQKRYRERKKEREAAEAANGGSAVIQRGDETAID